jgi:2-polyprenyl-6-methoxyphenol hydroxylase-like FAD-dependent oxidoreductase
MPERITIVGGGIAGLALGIGLRQRGVPVAIREAGHYPRHRVCGEFIGGTGFGILGRLGLVAGLVDAGARVAHDAAFFDGHRSAAARRLPEAALCISRHVLDAWLAGEFRRLGGDLREGSKWSGGFGDGIVRATGRRTETETTGRKPFGLKVHARGVRLDADLEMHFLPAGYVGLCRLADGVVNVCGLFHNHPEADNDARTWRERLAGRGDSVLRARLSDARFEVDSLCAVAGLVLAAHRGADSAECRIGDALTMVPPVTGDGMSMALASAELATEPLAGYSRGGWEWSETRQEIARRCDLRFARRLRWGGRLQAAIANPGARRVAAFATRHSEWFWRRIFAATR